MPGDLDRPGENPFFPGHHGKSYSDGTRLFQTKKDPMSKLNKMILKISPSISEYHRDLVKRELQNDGVLETIGSVSFYEALKETIYKVENRAPKVLSAFLKRDPDDT